MPRAPKTKAVIPTTSLVASAVRYPGKSARIYRPTQDWQAECYRHYEICGEARFAARFFGHALSRSVLEVGVKGDDGMEPGSPAATEILDSLFSGKDGQAEMLEALGIHLTIAGECFLVGRTVFDDNGVAQGEVWEIVSVLEMKKAGEKWSIDYGDGVQKVELTEDDVVIRIWIPSPGKRIEADSPFRSLLPILTEIEWLTRHIFAQTSSRLAGAGLLMMPQSVTFPPPLDANGEAVVTANEADAFMATLAQAMLAPISDPSSPSAMIPIVVTAPDDAIDKARLMHFWSELDAQAMPMRVEAIRRFALGMELPPEQVLGMSSNSGTGGGSSNGVSHWGAWQIEEATIKMFVEPMLGLICNALTIGYIRPLTDDPTQVVSYNTSSLRLRPDRSKEAMELYDRGLMSKAALLRENGFDVSDMPDDSEYQRWLLVKVASGSATPEMVAAALKIIGVDLGPVESSGSEVPNETRPDPTLDEHPEKPRTPEPSALFVAANALVFRALERAGNRIRQSEGIKPPGVPASQMHTLVQCNGSAPKYLADAWTNAPEILAGIAETEPTVALLESYVRTLFTEQQPHTAERLTKFLAVA